MCSTLTASSDAFDDRGGASDAVASRKDTGKVGHHGRLVDFDGAPSFVETEVPLIERGDVDVLADALDSATDIFGF